MNFDFFSLFFYLSISQSLSLPSSSYSPTSPTGFLSAAAATRPSAAELRNRRNAVFSREQARQRALYPRIEKIEVSLQGPGLDGTVLVMNKGMSTPLSCARRKPGPQSCDSLCHNPCFLELCWTHLCVCVLQTWQSITSTTQSWPWWTGKHSHSTSPWLAPVPSHCSRLKTATPHWPTRYACKPQW